MNVKFVSNGLDSSGMGSASRAEITALWVAGINVWAEVLHQVPEQTDLGFSGDLVTRLQGKKLDYKIKIVRLTPDMFPKYLESNVYTILRVVHETDKLPPMWVASCNQADELWTTTEERAQMLKASGVTKPIFVFPEPLDITLATDDITPFDTGYPKDFYFYAMFQWIERKNPKALLRAYFKAFEGRDDVTLVLKTYHITYQPQEFEKIKKDIADVKSELGLKHYPKIYLIKKLLPEKDVWKLHQMGDCFLSTSSGEGWNRPMSEAMVLGKPVISASCGGVSSVVNSNYYYAISNSPTQITIDPFATWYMADQNWKVIDEKELEMVMKYVFENYTKACEKGKKAQQFVVENFGYQGVGAKMKRRLEDVSMLLV